MRNSNQIIQPTQLLSLAEAAKILKIRRTEVSRIIHNGEIKVIELGKRIKIPASAIADWVESSSKYIVSKKSNCESVNLCYIENPKDLMKRLRRG